MPTITSNEGNATIGNVEDVLVDEQEDQLQEGDVPDSHTMATWGETAKNYVSTQLYQYIQFMSCEEDYDLNSPCQKAVCEHAPVPKEHISYFWLCRGKRDSYLALGRRRQSIGTALKNKFKELALTGSADQIPTPDDLLGDLFPGLRKVDAIVDTITTGEYVLQEGAADTRDYEPQPTEKEESLRHDLNGAYFTFCLHFMKCVFPAKTFHEYSKTRLLSNFITTSLEAFAVISYVNGYKAWQRQFVDTSDASAISTLTSGASGYWFTQNGKGAKKFEGWSTVGLDLYNAVVDTLEAQRREKHLGVDFDTKLMRQWQSSTRKRKRNQEGNERPTMRHNLNLIVQV